MNIEVNLPKSMSGITKGKDIVEVDGSTVGECLSRLISLFPGIEKELFFAGFGDSLATEGKLWSKIQVEVNGESIEKDVLAVKAKTGDKLHIEINTR